MNIRIENTHQYLLDNGIKPSLQRIKILDFLIKNDVHPTVDSIYLGLKNEMPTLSKTTVYNTLKLFNEKGITVFINIENNELRFDADVKFHGHFQCTECNSVYDFPVLTDTKNIKELNGFEIKESHYYLKGICNNCK